MTLEKIPLWLAFVLALLGATSLAIALLVDWTDIVARVLATTIGLWLAISGGIVLVKAVRRDRS